MRVIRDLIQAAARKYPSVKGRVSYKAIDLIQVVRYNVCMKVREVIKLIENDGWYLVRTRGSHRQFKHPTKKGVVTVAGKPADDVRKGALNSILKQAGLNPP